MTDVRIHLGFGNTMEPEVEEAGPAPTRDQLLTDLTRAVTRCFPDRAERILREVEHRLIDDPPADDGDEWNIRVVMLVKGGRVAPADIEIPDDLWARLDEVITDAIARRIGEGVTVE